MTARFDSTRGIWVVERGTSVQDIDPTTGAPFVSQTAAAAYDAAEEAREQAALAALAAAEQMRLAMTLVLTVVAKNAAGVITSRFQVGEPITFVATFQNALGQLIAGLNDTFDVPVMEPATGAIQEVIAVAVVAGVCTRQLAFSRSGYYELDERAVNSRLPPQAQVRMPAPLRITVYL